MPRSPQHLARPGRLVTVAVVVLALASLVGVQPAGADGEGFAFGRELWVAADGNDGASGSSARPLRTVERALALAAPGDTILVGAGRYRPLLIDGRSGAPGAPITVRSAPGSEGRVWFGSADLNRDLGIQVLNSQQLVFDGLNVGASQSGLRIAGGSHDIVFRNGEITATGHEGIAVAGASWNITIEGNRIHDTGRTRREWGEGIYLGNGSGAVDRVHDIVLRGNEIFATTAEAIDIKDHVYNVTVESNLVHDISTANSGAIVIGIGTTVYPDPNAVFRGNWIWNVTTTSPYSDGNGITLSAPATVSDNLIVNVQHRGILADGNFGNPDARRVRILRNTVIAFGESAIEAWTVPNPSLAEISDNRVAPSLDAPLVDATPLVRASYQDFLGRSPSNDELTYWVTRIQGGLAPRDYLRFLATSDAWLGATVQGLYQATLGRAADPAGVTYWVDQLRRRQATVPDVAARFFGSAEYSARFDGISGWVRALYSRLLGRAPDEAGTAYWSARTQEQGRDRVALELYQSTESRAVRVDHLYQALLGRAPDTAGRDYWAGRILADGDVSLAVDLASSAEYQDRARSRFPG